MFPNINFYSVTTVGSYYLIKKEFLRARSDLQGKFHLKGHYFHIIHVCHYYIKQAELCCCGSCQIIPSPDQVSLQSVGDFCSCMSPTAPHMLSIPTPWSSTSAGCPCVNSAQCHTPYKPTESKNCSRNTNFFQPTLSLGWPEIKSQCPTDDHHSKSLSKV